MKRDRLELIYSVTIIVAIPLLLVLNTIFFIRSTRAAFNQELRNTADTVNEVISESIKAEIITGNYTGITDELNRIEKIQSKIKNVRIIQQNGTNHLIIAKSASVSADMTASDQIQIKLVYSKKNSVARLIGTSSGGDSTQAWSIASPILDSNNSVLAVISSNILINDAQKTIDTVLQKSFLVTLISIIVIVALLSRHFRLVGYIQLLAKQKELNQTMSDFLSVATHELKAPTTIIKGYIANVIDETFGSVTPEIKEQLNVALSQTDRLNNLVQDLLSVSRVEQGRIEYNIEPVDSTSILNVIVSNYEPIAKAKGLDVTFDRRIDIPAIKADAGRVQEIFTNLVDNAIKYTPTGSVAVSQYVDGNNVVTTIKDTGLGMSAESQKRLFQRFYRIKTDRTKEISGTGLGLWIIKQYVIAMGGTVSVDSTEGFGSEFIVTFQINR